MRRKLVAGNWKMHGRRSSNSTLIQALCARSNEAQGVELWVAPPAVYLGQIAELLAGKAAIGLAAQNVACERDGALTGEVSAEMLADIGCGAVLVGHSERRVRYSESNAVVVEKFRRVQEAGMMPMLCIGESLAEREAGRTEEVVVGQLGAVLEMCGVDALSRSVIAYEPVWAIGTGRTATPEQAQEVHAALRSVVAERSPGLAAELRILYGGSVKGANASALFEMPDIDGALVGGASLDADEFLAIARAASRQCG
jgi:triosephosphate isomerase